jgi:TM2 domain-containing membrane protein YozV
MGNLEAKAGMTAAELALLSSEMTERRKSLALALLLVFFSGPFGVHRWYLGDRRTAFAMLGTFVVTFGLWLVQFIQLLSLPRYAQAGFFPWAILPFFGLFVWVFVDACFMPGAVTRENERIEAEAIAAIRSGNDGWSSTLGRKRALSERELALLESELAAKRKSLLLAYVLAKFLGTFSAHRFYVGAIAYGVATLAAGVLGLGLAIAFAATMSVQPGAMTGSPTSFFLVFGLFMLGAAVLNALLIVDEYRLPEIVARENTRIELGVLDRMHA